VSAPSRGTLPATELPEPADGAERTQLTHNEFEDTFAEWSPAGEWIAYVSNRNANREIYIMQADSTCLRPVTKNPGEDMYPT